MGSEMCIRDSAVDGAVRDAVGHANELRGEPADLPGGVGMVALDLSLIHI